MKQLRTAQLKCAELLIKNGCKIDDLTSGENPSTAVFFAVQSNSYELADFLVNKATTLAGKDEEGHNILHHCAQDFLFYSSGSTSLLQKMTDKFAGQLKQLAQEETTEGEKPLHRYYVCLKDLMGDGNRFYQYLSQWQNETREYLMAHLKTAMSDLDKVVTIYSQKLDVDVSSRVGVSFAFKEEAKQLMEQGGLKKAMYEKLIKLELDDFKVKAEDEEDGVQDKLFYSSSGVVID